MDWLTNSSFGVAAHVSPCGVHEAGSTCDPHQKPDAKLVTGAGSDSDGEYSQGHSRHKRKHKKDKAAKHDRHRDSIPARPQRELGYEHGASKKQAPRWLDDTLRRGEVTYYEDTHGDWDNVRYSTANRYSRPEYKRRFRKMCLGLRDNLEVCYREFRQSAFKAEDVKMKRNHDERYFMKSAVRSFASPGEAVAVRYRSAAGTHTEDFLQLDSGVSEQLSLSPVPEIKDHVRYHKLLAQDPLNVELWLEFIDSDSSLALAGGGTEAGGERSETAVLERKMAIVDKALAENPSAIELHIRRLQFGETLWMEDERVSRWKTSLHTFASSQRLWAYYLQLKCRGSARCSFQTVSSAFTRCVGTMVSIRSGTLKSHSAETGTDEFLLSVLCSYCSFLQQAGYCERAVAIFQAMIEFNMFCPASLVHADKPRSARLAFFDAFWDSGVGRIGTALAPGWKHWQANTGKADCTVTDPSSDMPCLGKEEAVEISSMDEEEALEEALVEQCESKSSAWVKTEQSREVRHWAPWTSDAECDDPDRCVLVDDVRPMLFSLSSEELHLRLVFSFLAFLGVRVPIGYQSSTDGMPRYYCHDVTASVQLESWCNGICDDVGSTMFSYHGTGHFAGTPGEALCSQWLSSNDVQRFADFVFKQAASCFSGSLQTQLLVVWFHHNARRCGLDLSSCTRNESGGKQKTKAVRAWAKALLKLPVNRANLALWEVYGRFEWACGKLKEACSVFEKVLGLASGMEGSPALSAASPELCRLYQTYAELLASAQNSEVQQSALYILISITTGKLFKPEAEPPTAIQIVRARRVYEDFGSDFAVVCAKLLSAVSDDTKTLVRRLAYTACLHGLFLSLTGDVSLVQEVLFRYATTLHELASPLCRWASELVSTFLVRLCLSRFDMHLLPVRQCASIVEKAILLFPCNCEFLSRYCQLLSPSHLVFQFRRFVDQHVLSRTAPVHVFGVAASLELERLVAVNKGQSSATVNRVRNLLDRALGYQGCQASVALWRLALHIEVSCLYIGFGNFECIMIH